MTQSVTLADELYDQFLVCRLCSSNYKQPKSLACMHTFCETCLEMHHEMEEQDRPYRFLMYTHALSCPICRIKTELPTGGIHRLPDNFLVANLGDVINRRKPSSSSAASPKCEICVNNGRQQNGRSKRGSSWGGTEEIDRRGKAVIKCLDCVKMLCQACADLHRRTKVTQKHSLFDVDVQKDVECKVHEHEPLRFYCEPCETCICVLCAFNEHKDHDVASLVEGLERHRGSFEALLVTCGGRIARMREQLERTEKCEKAMIRAETHIRDSAIEAIAAVRKREKELMADLRETVGESALKRIAEKDTARENLKNVEATFKFTDVMLKGTSIELLMVKKEIQEKLSNIVEQTEDNQPENLQSYLEFSVGDHYSDIPGMIGRKKVENGYRTKSDVIDTDFKERSVTSAEVQTDVAELKSVSTITDSDLIKNESQRKLDRNKDVSEGSDSRIKMVVNYLAGTEKELELIQPVEFIIPIEYVTPVSKEETKSETLEDPSAMLDPLNTAQSNSTQKNDENDSENIEREILFQNDKPKPSSTSLNSAENEEFVPPNANVNINAEISESEITSQQIMMPSDAKQPLSSSKFVSCATCTERPTLADFGTSMSSVLFYEKETSTPHVITTNKCVSTDNQEMVDKSTCTVVDVAAAYRNMTSSRRLVTVSRGTCTPRAMFPMEIFPPSTTPRTPL